MDPLILAIVYEFDSVALNVLPLIVQNRNSELFFLKKALVCVCIYASHKIEKSFHSD